MSSFRPRFFVGPEGLPAVWPAEPEVGAEIVLAEQDSHHALRVLRLQTGDECEVVVGAAVYAAAVTGTTAPVRVVLTSRLEGTAAGAVYRWRVGLVQALTRPALLDEVLEKGTEVGASFFVVVCAERSLRPQEPAWTRRLERWRRIVLEAAKQSKHLTVPTVEAVDSVGAAVALLSEHETRSLLLDPWAPISLREKLGQSPTGANGFDARAKSSLALWVGPESGWSEAEMHLCATAGIDAVKLGQGVLRAETAGPVAVAATRLLLGDW